MIAINPYGSVQSTGWSGPNPWLGGPSLAGSRLGLEHPMLGGAGGLGQMQALNELAYQALMVQLLQIMGGLMRQGASPTPPAPPAGGGGSTSESSSSSSGSSGVDPSQFSGGTDAGRRLAAEAKAEATNGDSQGGLCYRDVGRALAKIGISVSGGSAYMAAEQLAKNPKVREIKVSQDQLKSLPPGAIVVWDKGPGHPHGHISVAMGDGKEASDIMRNQITNYGTSFRVFMPV